MRICGTSDVMYKCFKTKILEKKQQSSIKFHISMFQESENRWRIAWQPSCRVILHHLRYSLCFALLHAIRKCPWLHSIRKKTADLLAFRRGVHCSSGGLSDLFNMSYFVSFQFEEPTFFQPGKGKACETPAVNDTTGGTTSFEPWGCHRTKMRRMVAFWWAPKNMMSWQGSLQTSSLEKIGRPIHVENVAQPLAAIVFSCFCHLTKALCILSVNRLLAVLDLHVGFFQHIWRVFCLVAGRRSLTKLTQEWPHSSVAMAFSTV